MTTIPIDPQTIALRQFAQQTGLSTRQVEAIANMTPQQRQELPNQPGQMYLLMKLGERR